MIRALSVIAALALGAGAAALAQQAPMAAQPPTGRVFAATAAADCQNVIKVRQALMKKSGAAAKAAAAMMKGATPFDLAKAKEIFATFSVDANLMPTLFPECSKTGENTSASLAIWQKRAEFNAAMAKFAADVKAAETNTKDLNSFKASFATIGHDCGGCHQTFRIKKT